MSNQAKVLIGMFHNRKDPNKVSRAYLYSAIAKMENAELFYFTASGVDLDRQIIRGKVYEAGEWIDKNFRFPDVIINASNQNERWQKQIENELKKMIPFTSNPVGSKPYVYQQLNKSEYLRQFLIPYEEVESIGQFFSFLEEHKRVVIKPIRGHHGENLVLIEKGEYYYHLTSGLDSFYLTKRELISYLTSLPYYLVVQKYINSRLKTGEPFDFRIHMQKNYQGKWQTTIIIPRVGLIGAVITNLSQGSQMIEFNSFIVKEFGKEANQVTEMVYDFATSFVQEFEKLYPYQFDELGIDVGLDEMKKLWVYEVNWRPGQKFIEVITGKNTVNYAIYLANQAIKQKGGQKTDVEI